VTEPLGISRLRTAVDATGPQRCKIVAIDGRGGAGKSSLANRLAAEWPRAHVIEMDDFYLPTALRPDSPTEPGAKYDLQRVIDQVLLPVGEGRPINFQRYDWDNDKLAEWQALAACAYVILEGVYSSSARLRPFLDFAIWVETPFDVRLARGLARDGESMRETWTQVWMPAEEDYVDAQHPEELAHLVVDGSGAEIDMDFPVIVDRSSSL
jgi:uridine kinase